MNTPDHLPVLTHILRPGRIPGPQVHAHLLQTLPEETGQDVVQESAQEAVQQSAVELEQERLALEQGIRLQVLQDLQSHIDETVRQRLDEVIGPLFVKAIADMTLGLQSGLRESMVDAVERAVAQEIARVEVQVRND